VEYELPRHDVIPAVTGYRYVKAKDVIQPDPRKEPEINKLYEKLIARVALRTLAEAFDAAPPTLVAGIVFNGYVSAKDRATGKPVRPLLLSVHAPREEFAEIILDEPELDPKACLRSYLNALISPHPYDLEAVAPVVQFDLRKFKFVEEMNVIAGLDSAGTQQARCRAVLHCRSRSRQSFKPVAPARGPIARRGRLAGQWGGRSHWPPTGGERPNQQGQPCTAHHRACEPAGTGTCGARRYRR
jgi:hypothetical protein